MSGQFFLFEPEAAGYLSVRLLLAMPYSILRSIATRPAMRP